MIDSARPHLSGELNHHAPRYQEKGQLTHKVGTKKWRREGIGEVGNEGMLQPDLSQQVRLAHVTKAIEQGTRQRRQ